MFESRDYQTEIVEKTWAALLQSRSSRPVIVMPTGSGKSWIIALLAKRIFEHKGRTLVLSHRATLLEQNEEKAFNLKTSFYCASLNQKDLSGDVVFASRDSLSRNFKAILKDTHFDVIMIDEAHRVGEDEESGYRKILDYLIKKNPKTRVIGLTATPFRLSGQINRSIVRNGSKEENRFFTEAISCVSTGDLIKQGYLSKLTCFADKDSMSPNGVKLNTQGDYDAKSSFDRFQPLVDQNVKSLIAQTKSRKKGIVFCCTIEHCEQVAAKLPNAVAITSKTKPLFRSAGIESFRNGQKDFLVGCEVFTEGFDVPDIDSVTLFRPTKSAALFVQMVGRGLRLAPEKEDCLVLDYGGNFLEHGRLDEIEVSADAQRLINEGGEAKICHECDYVNSPQAKCCEQCGENLVLEGHGREAVSSGVTKTNTQLTDLLGSLSESKSVSKIRIRRHLSKAAPPLPQRKHHTLRLDFFDSLGLCFVSEYLCLNHSGYARERALSRIAKLLGVREAKTVEQTLLELKQGFFSPDLPSEVTTELDNNFLKIDRIMERGDVELEIVCGEDIAAIGRSDQKLYRRPKPKPDTDDLPDHFINDTPSVGGNHRSDNPDNKV